MNAASDNQLMQEVKFGKVEKLALLFEKYHVRIYNFFLRLTGSPGMSEDLVQEVFLRILKYRSTFKGQSPFIIWVYQIARNVHIDHLRKQKPSVSLEDQWTDLTAGENQPAETLEKEHDIDLVREALHRLPVKKREIIVLSRYQDLQYKEIAELLGCRIGTVKAQVHRAIQQLGKIYRELQGGIAT